MPQPQPATPGQPLADVDTPALIVDLDAYEANVATMARLAREAGVRLRPHAKTHKSITVAHHQCDAGAIGICCQKVSEAEVFVAGGIRDVLITNEVWGRPKLARLAGLARQADVTVCVDHSASVAALAEAARRARARLGVLVEIDVGGRRCGTAPGSPAVALAKAIAAEPDALRFRGLQAYHGSAQHLRSQAERQDAIAQAAAAVRETLGELASAGLDAEIVGGAGTGTYAIEAATGLWNEIQPGSYVFMDADYARNRNDNGGEITTFSHALFALVTVMSVTPGERAIVDAGHKALSNDAGFPDIWQRPDLSYARPSDEHGVITAATPNAILPEVADRLLLVPGHVDPTVNLYDWFVGVRGLAGPDPRVECLWPVSARGCIS